MKRTLAITIALLLSFTVICTGAFAQDSGNGGQPQGGGQMNGDGQPMEGTPPENSGQGSNGEQMMVRATGS